MSANFVRVLSAEWKASHRRPLLYVAAAAFFVLAFHDIGLTSPTASGLIHIGRLWHNSPFIVTKLIAALSVLGTFAAAMLIAPAVSKDFLHRSDAFYLTLPIRRSEYVLGRFFGAFIAASVVYAGAIAGIIAANGRLDPEFRGPFHAAAFLQPLLLFALPNLLFTGAVCFAVATRTRTMLTAYIVAVILIIVLGVAQGAVTELMEKGIVTGIWRQVVALAEPFGAGAFQMITATWSIGERNTRLLLPLQRAWMRMMMAWPAP